MNTNNSIPHNPELEQRQAATLAPFQGENMPQFTPAALSLLEETALQLHAEGLNVSVQPPRAKYGWQWKPLQRNKLTADHLLSLIRLTGDDCNLIAMTGTTSGNLVVFDFETPELFQFYRAKFQAAGHTLRTVLTARGGHIYARCIDGEVKNMPTSAAAALGLGDMEIRGNNGYVMGVGSVHPTTGVIYQWQDIEPIPTLTLTELRAICSPIELQRTERATPEPPRLNSDPFPFLSYQNQEFMAFGAAPGTRNHRLFKAACDLAGNDVPYHEARHALMVAACDLSGLPEREAVATINSAYSQPRQPARPNTDRASAQQTAHWQHAAAWVAGERWTGRGGTTMRAVALALVERSKTARKGIFRASVREVAELARVGRSTASRQLQKLQARGFIQVVGEDQRSTAGLWKFTPQVLKSKSNPVGVGTPSGGPFTKKAAAAASSVNGSGESVIVRQRDTNLPGSIIVSHLRTIETTDAAELNALGKTAMLVYWALMQESAAVSPSTLARKHGLSRQQVNRALKRLSVEAARDYGTALVRRVGRGKYVGIAATDEQLDRRVAGPAGTLGAGDARKAEHAADRENHAYELIERDIFKWQQQRHTEPVQEAPAAPAARETGDGFLVDVAHDLGGVVMPDNAPANAPAWLFEPVTYDGSCDTQNTAALDNKKDGYQCLATGRSNLHGKTA